MKYIKILPWQLEFYSPEYCYTVVGVVLLDFKFAVVVGGCHKVRLAPAPVLLTTQLFLIVMIFDHLKSYSQKRKGLKCTLTFTSI